MIRGYCIGGGMGLALSCDMRICTEASKFAVPAAKLSIGYRYAGLKKLVDVVGPSFAKEIFYTARQFTAQEALMMGLVNRVLPDGELETYVKDYAETIAGNAPLTVDSVKFIVGEMLSDEAARSRKSRGDGAGLLCLQRLHRRPQGLHGKAQAEVHRHISSPHCCTA